MIVFFFIGLIGVLLNSMAFFTEPNWISAVFVIAGIWATNNIGNHVLKNKTLLSIIPFIILMGCSTKTEVVKLYEGVPGKDGVSCSVVPEVTTADTVIGVRVFCSDGSSAVVLNGSDGADTDVIVTTVVATSYCKPLGTVASIKQEGESNNVKYYSSTDCSGPSTTLRDRSVTVTSLDEIVIKVSGSTSLKLFSFN